MKPDYNVMTTAELTAYVLSHRDDVEAIDALVDRRSPDSEATWFEGPKSAEDMERMSREFEQELKKRIQKQD